MPAIGRSRRSAIAISSGWCAAVAGALVLTLSSLERDDFDGLNNIFQIPFALPWFILPVGTSNHVLNAWVAAAMGWANAVLIFLWLTHSQPRPRRP